MSNEPTTDAEEAPRVKLNVDVDPIIRDALGRRSAKLRLAHNREVPFREIVNGVLHRELAEEIAELQRGEPPPRKRPRKK